jgi:hypothetical protein
MKKPTKDMNLWYKCLVNSGPFSNERRVLISASSGDWFGSVQTHNLLNKVERGEDYVLTHVVEIQPNRITLLVDGESVGSGYIYVRPSELNSNGKPARLDAHSD